MVEGIVNSILSGVTSGLWHMLGAIPLSVYLVAFVSLIAVVFILRYATNWKVDLTVMAAVFIVSEILAVRQHWIRLGQNEAKVQIAAAEKRVEDYKATNQLVIACYAKDSEALIWIWDRTQGKCVRVDGSQ
jgi:hypothetical protein